MHPVCTYPVGETRMNETHLSPVRRWQLSEQGKQLLLDLTWGQTGCRPGDNGQGELVRERWARESQSVELSCARRLWPESKYKENVNSGEWEGGHFGCRGSRSRGKAT